MPKTDDGLQHPADETAELNPTGDPAIAEDIALAGGPAVVEAAMAQAAAETDGEPKKAYLTTRMSETYGGRGWFVDLSDADAAAGLADGTLVEPTPEQLARRVSL